MAYDDELANRIRGAVQGERGLTEKQMFGGLAFLIHGNMAVSASSKGGLLLRVDPAATESLVSEPRAALRDARPGDGRLASRRRPGAGDRRRTPTLGEPRSYLRPITPTQVAASRHVHQTEPRSPACACRSGGSPAVSRRTSVVVADESQVERDHQHSEYRNDTESA